MTGDNWIFGLTLVAATASSIAAGFAWQTWRTKTGIKIRGYHSIHSTIDCDDKFVGSVTLENSQDRAAVIFKIFLKVGRSYFILLEDLSESPLILQPFQAVHREYLPLEHYVSGSGGRIDMNALLDDAKIAKRLVLATPAGEYRVRYSLRYWDPVILFFRNHFTGVVHPQRNVVDGETYGANIKYVVKLTLLDGRIEWVRFRAGENRLKVFREFDLTQDSLASASALEGYLLERAVGGELKCTDLKVYDLDKWRDEVYELERRSPPFVAPPLSWFQYEVLGRIVTWQEKRKMRKQNLATRQQHQARIQKAREETKEMQDQEDGMGTPPN